MADKAVKEVEKKVFKELASQVVEAEVKRREKETLEKKMNEKTD